MKMIMSQSNHLALSGRTPSPEVEMKAIPSRKPQRDADRSAFTLTDLLVVVATIALLAVTLLPALAASSGERVRRTACLNNLRQIAIAMTVYAANNGDRVIPVKGGNLPIIFGSMTAATAATVGLVTNTASIWTCPNRPGLPYKDVFGQWNLGYQYYGGIGTWLNSWYPGGIPSHSPVKLSQSQPYWMLAADPVIKVYGKWGVTNLAQLYANLPQHHGSDSLVPQGGNEVFCDGSARWIQFEKMYYFHTWTSDTDPNGPANKACFFYQDPKDFPPVLIQLLPMLRAQP
jgi:type II secretory pathway pseudopilin PulG